MLLGFPTQICDVRNQRLNNIHTKQIISARNDIVLTNKLMELANPSLMDFFL